MDVWLEIPVTMLAALSVLGLLYRYVVEPNMDKRFARIERPIVETHEQLLKNGGKNEPPTVPDNFHAVHEALSALNEKADALATRDDAHAKSQQLLQANFSALIMAWDQHMHWSGDKVDALEERIAALRSDVDRLLAAAHLPKPTVVVDDPRPFHED